MCTESTLAQAESDHAYAFATEHRFPGDRRVPSSCLPADCGGICSHRLAAIVVRGLGVAAVGTRFSLQVRQRGARCRETGSERKETTNGKGTYSLSRDWFWSRERTASYPRRDGPPRRVRDMLVCVPWKSRLRSLPPRFAVSWMPTSIRPSRRSGATAPRASAAPRSSSPTGSFGSEACGGR